MGVGRHVGTAAKLTAGQKTTKLGLGAGERGREFFFVFIFLGECRYYLVGYQGRAQSTMAIVARSLFGY